MNIQVTISQKFWERHVRQRRRDQKTFIWFALPNNFVDWPEWHKRPHSFLAIWLHVVGIASEANNQNILLQVGHSAHKLGVSEEVFLECLRFFKEKQMFSLMGDQEHMHVNSSAQICAINYPLQYNTNKTIQHKTIQDTTSAHERSPESANLKTEKPSDVSQGSALHPQTSSRLITGNSSTTGGKKLRPLVGTSYEAFFDHYHQKGQEFTEGFLSKEYKKIEKYYQDRNIPLTINLVKRWMSSEITQGAWEKYLKSDAYTIEMIQCMALVEQEKRDKGGQNV